MQRNQSIDAEIPVFPPSATWLVTWLVLKVKVKSSFIYIVYIYIYKTQCRNISLNDSQGFHCQTSFYLSVKMNCLLLSSFLFIVCKKKPRIIAVLQVNTLINFYCFGAHQSMELNHVTHILYISHSPMLTRQVWFRLGYTEGQKKQHKCNREM